jgi:hypothetical protein
MQGMKKLLKKQKFWKKANSNFGNEKLNKLKTQLKALPVDWIKQKTECEGLKTR